VWRPNPATAGTYLHHKLQGRGNYTWSLVSPALSASIAASGVAPGTTGGDQVLVEQLRTARPGYSRGLREMVEAGVLSPSAEMESR